MYREYQKNRVKKNQILFYISEIRLGICGKYWESQFKRKIKNQDLSGEE